MKVISFENFDNAIKYYIIIARDKSHQKKLRDGEYFTVDQCECRVMMDLYSDNLVFTNKTLNKNCKLLSQKYKYINDSQGKTAILKTIDGVIKEIGY